MFKSFARIGKQAENGQVHYAYVFKPTTPVPGTAGVFVDLNQSSGIPRYNGFAGTALSATPLVGSGNNGINPGPFVEGSTKHLLRLQALQLGATPDYLKLCDYLMFYPLIDAGDDTAQLMDNTESLPRYQTGEGVRIVLIVTAPVELTAPLTIEYTNSDGVSGRTATANVIPNAAIGACITAVGTAGTANAATPFFPLANGDQGVRSIESVTFGAAAGGFVCAALVKPLADLNLFEANVPVERQVGFEKQNLPEIKPGAYLNFLIQRGSTTAGNYRAELVFINS
jgi:hypothetical protein